MQWRNYESERDRAAAYRIWREVGWMGEKESPEELDRFITGSGRGFVAELNGEPECLVLTSTGDLRYLRETLPFACVTGVTTSRIARKQAFAGCLTASAVATEAAEGAAVAGLGMFDQGYYNRLGFGTGTYEHAFTMVTENLQVDVTPRVPLRLGMDDWERIHAARLKRARGHGSASLFAAPFTCGRMHDGSNQFGLGYADDPDGGLSHLIFCSTDNVADGPYGLKYLVYRTPEQLLELLALLRSLHDQVRSIRLPEPAGIQLQDLVRKPFKTESLTRGSRHHSHIEAYAWWQMRICDLAACLEKTHLSGGPVRFNLRLSDPIAAHLDDSVSWRGVAGDYVVTLGPQSAAEPGSDAALPTLAASVNAFTRLWLGVRPATGLAVTDDLSGPEGLLEELDEVLRLPVPHPDWDF